MAVLGAVAFMAQVGLLYPSFPKRQHTLVVGLWAGVAAVAASAEPPVGGSVLVLATVEGPHWGRGDGRSIGLFVAAVFALATLQRTPRARAPIIEKELFTSRAFTAATIALLVALTSMTNTVSGFGHALAVQLGAGLLAAGRLFVTRQHSRT